jgi:hypothetical protein
MLLPPTGMFLCLFSFDFHGRSYFEATEAEGGVGGAQKADFGKEEESEALWGEEAWGLHCSEAGGSGASRYHGCSVFSLDDIEHVVNEY